ncbi:hypothetical protein [Nostoc sp. UHCC 0302]
MTLRVSAKRTPVVHFGNQKDHTGSPITSKYAVKVRNSLSCLAPEV